LCRIRQQWFYLVLIWHIWCDVNHRLLFCVMGIGHMVLRNVNTWLGHSTRLIPSLTVTIFTFTAGVSRCQRGTEKGLHDWWFVSVIPWYWLSWLIYCAIVEPTAMMHVQNYAASGIKRGSARKYFSGWHEVCLHNLYNSRTTTFVLLHSVTWFPQQQLSFCFCQMLKRAGCCSGVRFPVRSRGRSATVASILRGTTQVTWHAPVGRWVTSTLNKGSKSVFRRMILC